MVPLPRFRILDTAIHAVDHDDLSAIARSFLNERKPRQIVTVNVDFLRLARSFPEFNSVINNAALAVPDGKPLVWAAHYLGLANCQRVTGMDVIDTCAHLSAEHGHRIFLLGGGPGIAQRAQAVLESNVPGVQICGAWSPPPAEYPFPEALDSEIISVIRRARPDILFVGFGAPKQDLWIHDHLEALEVPLSVGIGGCFNFLCGLVPRAPLRMQRLGMEWAYRFFREPRRLWRRYLVDDLPFVFRVTAREVGWRAGLARPRAVQIEA